MKWLTKYADLAYALLRIMAGFMFSFHGAQKILGVLSEFQPAAGSQLWFGGIIELLGGVAVMLGFKTRGGFYLQRRGGCGLFPISLEISKRTTVLSDN